MSNLNDSLGVSYTKNKTEEKSIVHISMGTESQHGHIYLNRHKIIFILEGSINYTSKDFTPVAGIGGQLLFLPQGEWYTYSCSRQTKIITISLQDPIILGGELPVGRLYTICDKEDIHESVQSWEVHPALKIFIACLEKVILTKICSEAFFKMKKKELLFLLRECYINQELYSLFHRIITPDTAFSEYIRLNWHKYYTVADLAEAMNMTSQQFTRRFTGVFNMAPYRWMMDKRAQIITRQIREQVKSLKQIAFDNGFSTSAQLTRFCKRMTGKTPTQIRET